MGRLCIDAWQRITNNAQVLDWVRHGVQFQFTQEPPRCVLDNHLRDSKQFGAVDREIQELLEWGAISPVARETLHCVLPYKSHPKRMAR